MSWLWLVLAMLAGALIALVVVYIWVLLALGRHR